MRKALVTGATGFIGAPLCRALAAGGVEVTGVARRAPAAADGGLRVAVADLADADSARRVLAEAAPDVVFHLASSVTGARGVEHVLPTFRDNLATTVSLLVAVARESCPPRVVLAGSLEETADDATVPVSPYAAAKTAASLYARTFHALYATPVVTARLFMVYGPGQKDRKKLVPYTTLAMLRGEAARLSSGERPVDWVYVEDAVEGLIRLGEAPGVEGEALDVGSGELHTVREVVEILGKLTGGGGTEAWGAVADRPMERVRAAHAEETEARTGWRARTALEEGLARTVAWYRAHPDEDG